MLKLLREDEVTSRFRQFRKSSGEIMVAVPFWGEGAIKSLGLPNGQKVRIVCNLDSGACNPHVISKLMKLKGIRVRTHSRLHAKIYTTNDFSIVGSSNASTNGLALEGDTTNGWVEANVLSDDVSLVKSTVTLFKTIWNEAKAISPTALRQALSAWDNRPKRPSIAPTAKTLLAACREKPEMFQSVFVVAYDEDLDPGGKACLKKVKEDSVSTPGLAASAFRKACGFQFEEKFEPGSWLVELDCRNSNKPKIWGVAQVPTPMLRLKIKGEMDLTLAVRGTVEVDGRWYRLSEEEKKGLETNAKHILERMDEGESIRLIEAIKIIDERRKKAR